MDVRLEKTLVPELSRSVSAAFSFTYSLLLTSLPLMIFKDRDNYLNYAEYSKDILAQWYSIGNFVSLANEPIWLLINILLSFILSSEYIIRSIIFFPSFIISYSLLRVSGHNWPWMMLFLFFPMVLKNHITHLRQGLAISVFILGIFSDNKIYRRALLLITPFIHASFFFILGLNFITLLLRRLHFGPELRSIIHLSLGITVGVSLSMVVALLGARQAERYTFSAGDISGLGFVFWTIVLMIFAFQGRVFLARHALAFGAIIFYLGTYFFIEITARIFESLLPLILLAGLELTRWRLVSFLSATVSYGALQWVIWLTQEGPVL